MNGFDVNIEYVYTDAAHERFQNARLVAGKIAIPGGGAPLPIVGDEVSLLAEGENADWITFRVSARRFLMQPVLPQMTLILTLDILPETS